MTSTMQRSTTSHHLGGRWLRGPPIGDPATTPLVGAAREAFAATPVAGPAALREEARAAHAIELVGGRLRGELRGIRTDEAVEQLARLVGARLFWTSPAGRALVRARLTGLTVEQALARLLGDRSYLLVLGERPEIHVLSGEEDDEELGGASARETSAAPTERERELARLRRMAEVDQIAHADAESEDVGAELDAIVRSKDEPAVRLAAAERLLAIDPDHAAGALAWLTSDADPMVRRRAEALLAAAR